MIPHQNLESSASFTRAVFDAVPEPVAALDDQLRLMTASRSFYEAFGLDPDRTEGLSLYALANGRLDTPELRDFLETVLKDRPDALDIIEVEQDLADSGHRVMELNARKLNYGDHDQSTIVLAFTDVTARRELERDRIDLLAQTSKRLRDKEILLKEVQHRLANSLQTAVSILRMHSAEAESEEVRYHLKDAYLRLISVGEVQAHLADAANQDTIDVSTYLSRLANSLASSMTHDRQPIRIEARVSPRTIPSNQAVSIGLAVTELVINAIKFAFPVPKQDARILIAYDSRDTAWKLTVSDNGIGNGGDVTRSRGPLARLIVNALVKQLDARMIVTSGPEGLAVSILSPTWVTPADC